MVRDRMMQKHRISAGFPEVERVVAKAARANNGKDPAGLATFEAVVNLSSENWAGDEIRDQKRVCQNFCVNGR